MQNNTMVRFTRWTRRALLWCALAALAPAALGQAAEERETLKEVQLASDRFVRGTPLPGWVDAVTTLPATQSRQPVVFLLADTQLMVQQHNSAHVHRAWQINDASSLNHFTPFRLEFQANYEQMQLHQLRIHRKGRVLDQTRSAKIRFLQRESGLEQGVYNGEVTASILIEDLRVGDVLEVAYTIEGENPVFRGKYSEFSSWDASIPTERRRITLNHPVQRAIEWRALGTLMGAIPAPTEKVSAGMRQLRWEDRNQPAVEVEPYTSNAFITHRMLQFTEYRNWQEVADWAAQLFAPREPIKGELLQVVERLQALPSTEQRVAAALAWVQSEIRYFSVSLGESSHRPHAPNETLARRYGDCKDKSFLLIELLRALGVPAQPVLVSTRTRTLPARLLPTPHAFDHAIVRVTLDDRDYFLDPTRHGQHGRLDSMGQVHEGSQVLVAQPGSHALTTIASVNRSVLTRDELQETIRLPKFGGEGTLDVRSVWRGVTAENSRIGIAQLTREQLEKALMEPYEGRYPGIRRAADSTVEDDTERNVLVVTSRYAIPNLAVPSDGDWGIRFGALNMRGTLPAPPSATRTQPMGLPSLPRTLQYNATFEFPPEVSVISDPSTSKVTDPAFDYTVSYTFRGNRATAAITMRIYKTQVEAGDTVAYMTALRRVNEITRGYMVVRKNEIKSTGLFGLGAQTLQQTMQARLQQMIGNVSKSIEEGKLQGDDLADAYCLRATANLDLDKTEEGLKDAQLAVKTAPHLAESYNCRASAWFSLGDYPRSIADYSKAISLGKNDWNAYYRRGQARFYNGLLPAALNDFEQARLAKGVDPDDALYVDLWRTWTQKRLGRTADAEQLAQASADPRGNWPRPALAMLHGLLSVEEMLQWIEANKKGDEKEMALTEAYFYIGQHYMAQGDKTKAADYFRKTREKGITMYVEHVGAGAELKQLGLSAN